MQIPYQKPVFSVLQDDGTFVTLVAQVDLPGGAGAWERRESLLRCRHAGEGLTCDAASLDFSASDPALAARAFLQTAIDANADQMSRRAEPAVVTQTQQHAFQPLAGVDLSGVKGNMKQLKAETVWADAVRAKVHLSGAFVADVFLIRPYNRYRDNRWVVTDQTFSGPADTPIHPQWTAFTQPQEVTDLRPVGDDLWIASLNSGVSRCSATGGQCEPHSTSNGHLVNDYVQAIATDGKGTLWFGTVDGVTRFDGKTWQDYREKDGLPSADVVAIAVDGQGAVWFGGSGGVSRFDGQTWRTYTSKDGLAGNKVHTIAVDKQGTVWLGTTYGGVSHFDGQTWRTYTQKDGLTSNRVQAIVVDGQGALWFGTDGGVSRFDGQTWRTYAHQDGLASDDVRALAVDAQGALWFGTNDAGVSRFDGQTWHTYTPNDGLPSAHVGTMTVGGSGTVWFGGEGGVSRFDQPKQ
jgi:ligand-binding sensor domain-containing protein